MILHPTSLFALANRTSSTPLTPIVPLPLGTVPSAPSQACNSFRHPGDCFLLPSAVAVANNELKSQAYRLIMLAKSYIIDDPDKAQDCLRKILAFSFELEGAIKLELIRALAELGARLVDKARYDDGLALLREAHRLAPDSQDLQVILAGALCHVALLRFRRDHDKSLRNMREAYELCPGDHVVRRYIRNKFVSILGVIAVEKRYGGEPKSAVLYLTEALKLDPDNEDVKSLLAELLASEMGADGSGSPN